jgi:hypothetical protein
MTGLQRFGSAFAACVALGAPAAFPAPARASDVVSVYVAAQGIERRAGNVEVVIHGAFLMLAPDGLAYGEPQCGYMYFRCGPGDEEMCALQWQDVERIGTGASTCAGFGQRNVASPARVRAAGTTPAEPDLWDLGIGVTAGTSISGKCPIAKALDCSRPAAPDAGSVPTSGSGGGSPATAGSGGAAGGDGTGGGQPGQGATGGTSGKALAGGRSGCAVAASAAVAPTPWAVAAAAAAAQLGAAVFLRLRRRRRGVAGGRRAR